MQPCSSRKSPVRTGFSTSPTWENRHNSRIFMENDNWMIENARIVFVDVIFAIKKPNSEKYKKNPCRKNCRKNFKIFRNFHKLSDLSAYIKGKSVRTCPDTTRRAWGIYNVDLNGMFRYIIIRYRYMYHKFMLINLLIKFYQRRCCRKKRSVVWLNACGENVIVQKKTPFFAVTLNYLNLKY